MNNRSALSIYQALIDRLYDRTARVPENAFTWLEAFGEHPDPSSVVVPWRAFPITANATPEQIDRSRTLQDEYIEWQVEREAGAVKRIIFTTEFPEYYMALAFLGVAQLIEGIRQVIPSATPSAAELFGVGFNPTTASPANRMQRFLSHIARNPWTNGEKGILFLIQGANTLEALFGLVEACALARNDLPPSAVCANVGGSCVPGRASDPAVCSGVQQLAQSQSSFSLVDPVGVVIRRLQGEWRVGGQAIDINDSAANGGAWTVSRNGRRAVLDLSAPVTQGTTPGTSGAQVARSVEVGVEVVAAPDSELPDWARAGNESLRGDS